MHVQYALYSRSIIEADRTSTGSGGVEKNTIILIVVGVVSLLAILIGFCLVSRPRGANAPPSPHPEHSPTTSPPPRRGRDMSESWKIWKLWPLTPSTDPHTTTNMPSMQVVPPSPAIANPSQILPAGGDPRIPSRPSQSRRVTSLSVATSFSHSHITQEELNNFRLSAYDLDDDLESEMLHSAMDDVWPGRPLVVEEGGRNVGMEKNMASRGDITPVIEGSFEDYVPPTTQRGGGDYENSGQGMASGSNGGEGDVVEVNKGAMG